MQNAKARVRPTKLHLVPLNSIFVLLLSVAVFAQAQAPATAPAAKSPGYYDPLPQDTGEAGLKQELRKLQTTGRLMMVVAHPDDEDGGLLTLEARGKGVQTLLMTLTRGEGGQNKTGDTFSDELGVLRTLELLASDRYYGVEQRFSRVADFGYSKTPEETFQKWGGHDVPLADIVRVIRTFRPDVLVARFSGTDRDGHGHHQASAILTKEAFRAAGDPNRFPDQIKEGLQPWQPKKLYIGNVCGFGASTCVDENYTVKINTGEEDPVLGMSYAQFAIQGLKHQQSQGLADISIPSGPRYAFYKLADSVVPKTTDASGHEKDLFDGIDTSLPGLASRLGSEEEKVSWLRPELKKAAGRIGDSADALSNLVGELDDLSEQVEQSSLSANAREEIWDLITAKDDEAGVALNLALNSQLEAAVSPPKGPDAPPPPFADALTCVSPGQRFQIVSRLHNNSKYFFNIQGAELEPFKDWVRRAHADQATIDPKDDYYANFFVQVPPDAPLTRPYWHREHPQTDSIYKVDEAYQTMPFPPNRLHSIVEYNLAGHRGLHSPLPDSVQGHSVTKFHKRGTGRIDADVEVQYINKTADSEKIPLAVVPTFSVVLEPAQQALPLSDGKETTVSVGVSSNLTGAPQGSLHLDLPSGWRAEPSSTKVNLAKRGDKQDFSFKVFPANLAQGRAEIHAVLDVGGNEYSEGYTLVTREDLGAFYYFEPAVQHVSIVDVKVPKDLKVGYIMGAGDDIPNVLQQIGMHVTLIPADKIATEQLAQYGTIILGVRAYDTHKDLVANNKKLLDFVSNGGTLIVQNNNSVGDFNSGHFTPFPANLSRARVSVEEAPVQILDPGNSAFHYPNEISQKDFDAWVQERGLYFMDSWDDHFKALLSCHDPGEPDQKGGLLEAKYGKGTYIYTGYAFFRQLPAGVPGAIRLFVNLVSAGHEASVSNQQ
jgi:LmbE family N-acetylglucosaminyl deacetylase